jgi:hypothetical protein
MVYDKNYDKEGTPRRGRSNLTNLAFWRVVIFMEYITSKNFA